MPATKANKLRSQWTDTKIEMLAWIQKTISMMEPGTNAKDVESMVNASGKLIKMLGDISPDDQGRGLEDKDLTKATERVRWVARNFNDFAKDSIFGEEEEDEDDD